MSDAGLDWERRRTRRSRAEDASAEVLPPPGAVRAQTGRGHVALDWDEVPGAVAYVIFRAAPGKDFERLDHGGGDIIAITAPPYADTSAAPGVPYRYAVASLSAPDSPRGELSADVEGLAGAATFGDGTVAVTVDVGRAVGELARPWWMVGSEHLSQITYRGGAGPRPIGEEFADALRMAVEDLGVSHARAHAILHDELRVYREVDGVPRFNFDAVDDVYDRILDIGCRPIVEVSFMPRDLASNPEATVFTYGGIISPPKDWERWAELNQRLAAHLVERYGADEVARWAFEIWNEPNLEVFWTGTQGDYFRLYELAARAIKSVDERLRVGGPGTAAGGWIPAFLDFVRDHGVPVDFVSTHAYGVPPLNLRALLARKGFGDLPIWWTEWGTSPTHFGDVNDSVFGAPFVLRGMKMAQKTATDALSYWVISDHFEELGRPPRLLHGGFGLLTVGNLRKPRYWALALANRLGPTAVDVDVTGDGALSLVDALATTGPDGTVDVLVWNGGLEQHSLDGGPALRRRLDLRLRRLPHRHYAATLARIDAEHSNIKAHWDPRGTWPDAAGWRRLRAADRLHEEPVEVAVEGGRADLSLDLPCPCVLSLRLQPAG